jgi:hypothetical protein
MDSSDLQSCLTDGNGFDIQPSIDAWQYLLDEAQLPPNAPGNISEAIKALRWAQALLKNAATDHCRL